MSQQDKIDRTIDSLHEAMLGDAHWQATSLLLEDAFGAKGTHLVILDNRSPRAPAAWPEWLFDQIYFRGVERDDIRQRYVRDFFPHDERVPRMVRLPENRVVPVTKMFTERELITSPTYNDALLCTDCQRGFNMRMDGPDGLDIILAIADPVDSNGWNSGDIETMEHLLPHIRQFIRVRHALVRAQALGTTLTDMLANAMVGVIYLDRRGMIVEANSRAREILRRGDGLVDRDGALRARQATDDARLGKLLADSMPGAGRQPVSNSMTVERSLLLPRLVVHVTPVVVHQLDFGARSAAALVLIVDCGKQARCRRRPRRKDLPPHARREPGRRGAGSRQHGARDCQGNLPGGEFGAVVDQADPRQARHLPAGGPGAARPLGRQHPDGRTKLTEATRISSTSLRNTAPCREPAQLGPAHCSMSHRLQAVRRQWLWRRMRSVIKRSTIVIHTCRTLRERNCYYMDKPLRRNGYSTRARTTSVAARGRCARAGTRTCSSSRWRRWRRRARHWRSCRSGTTRRSTEAVPSDRHRVQPPDPQRHRL